MIKFGEIFKNVGKNIFHLNFFGCNFAPVRQKKKAARNQSRTLLSLSLSLCSCSSFSSPPLPTANFAILCNFLVSPTPSPAIPTEMYRQEKSISWRQEANADDDDRKILVEKVLGLDRVLGLSLSKIWQLGKQFFRKWGIGPSIFSMVIFFTISRASKRN